MRYDVHAHLDLYKDRNAVIKRLEDQKMYVISMTNLPQLYEKYCCEYPALKYIRFALGLHPELIKDHSQQITHFLSLLPQARYVGEVGLDYSVQRSAEDRKMQRQVFERIITSCKKCTDPKILSIHSRAAANDIIDIVGNYHGQVILHWLSDKDIRINKAVDNGYYFSINNQMVGYKSGQSLICKMPIDHILLESDAPFTKGYANEYAAGQQLDTVERLAGIYGIPLRQMQDIMSNNFKRLLNNEK